MIACKKDNIYLNQNIVENHKKHKRKGIEMSCDYMGKDFGAWYIDSECVDGYLRDCDKDGEVSDIPCPKCNHAEWLEYSREEIKEKGFIAYVDGLPPECTIVPRYPEDKEIIKAWWLKGYDEAKREHKAIHAEYEKRESLREEYHKEMKEDAYGRR